MPLERDNAAEHLARIDRLMAEMKGIPPEQKIARVQALIQVVSLPQGPVLAVGRRPLA